MALTVIQRPDANLYVNDPPEYQEQPYYYSRWSAAFLPLVYKISNTKFPTNEEDGVDVYTTVTNRQGYARLNLVTSYETYIVGEKLTVNGSVYKGVYEIREVGTGYVTLDVAFTVTDSGTAVRYYENYSTLIKLYAGVPEGHSLYATDPMTYIGTYSIAPNLQNVAIIDIADLVKQKISQNNDISGTGRPNDLNAWTSFYIEFAETYDVYENRIPSTFISSYTVDNLQGITPVSVTNPDFTSNLNGWSQIEHFGNNNWVWDSGSAKYPDTGQRGQSKNVYQEINLKKSIPYKLILDYEIDGIPPNRRSQLTVMASNKTTSLEDESIFCKITSTDVAETVTVYFTPNQDLKYLVFEGYASTSAVTFKVNSINIEEAVVNYDVAYIFASNSTRQFYDTITKKRSIYGGNMAEYVMNYNEQGILGKFLTRFEKPLLFPNNYFDISAIIPQSTIDIPYTEDGLLYRVKNYNESGDLINTIDTEIVNNGDGVYRLRLDNKVTGSDSTVQLVRQQLEVNQLEVYFQGNTNIVGYSIEENSFVELTLDANFWVTAVSVFKEKAIVIGYDSVTNVSKTYLLNEGVLTLQNTFSDAYDFYSIKAFDENNFIATSNNLGYVYYAIKKDGAFTTYPDTGLVIVKIVGSSWDNLYAFGGVIGQPAIGLFKFNGSTFVNIKGYFLGIIVGTDVLTIATNYLYFIYDDSNVSGDIKLSRFNINTNVENSYNLTAGNYKSLAFESDSKGYIVEDDTLYLFDNGTITTDTSLDALRTSLSDNTSYLSIVYEGDGIYLLSSAKRIYRKIGTDWVDCGVNQAGSNLKAVSASFEEEYVELQVSELKPIEIDSECSKYNIYLSWINRLGNWEYFKFTERKTYEKNVENTLVRRNIFDAFPDKFTSETQDDKIRIESVDKVTVRSQYMTRERLDIVTEIIESIRVQQWLSNTEKITVIVDTDSISKYTDGDKLFAIEFDIIYPDNIIQNQ